MRIRAILRPSIELLVMNMMLFAIDRYYLAGDGFAGLEPNPFWLPVLIFPLAYGTGFGLAAAAIASLFWIAAPHDRSGGADQLEYLLQVSMLPMLWTVVALALGEVTAARLASIAQRDGYRREVEEKQERIAEALAALTSTNRALQVRIATDNRTVGEAIAVAVDLIEPNEDCQMRAIERLIALSAQSEDFTFYEVRAEGGIARFRGGAARHRPAQLSHSTLSRTLAAIAIALSEGQSSSAETQSVLGVAALPVYNQEGDSLTGLLVVHSGALSLITQAKLAELSHVAASLGKISASFPDHLALPVPGRWNLTEELVA